MNSAQGVVPQSLQESTYDVCTNINLWQKRTIFNAKASMIAYVDDLANQMYELDSVLDELIGFWKTFRAKYRGPEKSATETTNMLFFASMEQVGNVILSLSNLHEQIFILWKPWNDLLGKSKYEDIPKNYKQPSKFDDLPLAAQERTEDLRNFLESQENSVAADNSNVVWNNFTSQCLRRRDELIESFHNVIFEVYNEVLQDESESLFFRVLYAKLLKVYRKKNLTLAEEETKLVQPANTESFQIVSASQSPKNEPVVRNVSPEAQQYIDLLTANDANFDEQKKRFRKLVLKVHPDKNMGDDTKQRPLQEAVATLKENEPLWGNLAGGFTCRINFLKQPHELNQFQQSHFRRILLNNLPYEDQARAIVNAKDQMLILFQAQMKSPLSQELKISIQEFPDNEVVNLARKQLRPRMSVDPLPKYLTDPDLEALVQDYVKVFSQNDQEASQISKKTYQKLLKPLSLKEQLQLRKAQKDGLSEVDDEALERSLDRAEAEVEAAPNGSVSKAPEPQVDIQSLVKKIAAGHFEMPSGPTGFLVNMPFECT